MYMQVALSLAQSLEKPDTPSADLCLRTTFIVLNNGIPMEHLRHAWDCWHHGSLGTGFDKKGANLSKNVVRFKIWAIGLQYIQLKRKLLFF